MMNKKVRLEDNVLVKCVHSTDLHVVCIMVDTVCYTIKYRRLYYAPCTLTFGVNACLSI